MVCDSVLGCWYPVFVCRVEIMKRRLATGSETVYTSCTVDSVIACTEML